MLLNERAAKGVEYREGYFEHDGDVLHYIEAGEGEPIVFFYGFPSYWFSFVRQIENFGGDYRVIAIDGHENNTNASATDPQASRSELSAFYPSFGHYASAQIGPGAECPVSAINLW